MSLLFLYSVQTFLYVLAADLVSLVHQLLRWMQVKGGLFVVVVNVDPGLQVGDVEGITEGLDMRAENKVIRSKQGLDSVAHLITYLAKILVYFFNLKIFYLGIYTLFVVLNESSLGTY